MGLRNTCLLVGDHANSNYKFAWNSWKIAAARDSNAFFLNESNVEIENWKQKCGIKSKFTVIQFIKNMEC